MTSPFASLFLENQLCFPLYAASRLTTKLYASHLKKLGITYPQYLVMLVLWEEEALAVKEIGARLYLESNTLTPLLKRLEQKGLLERERSKEDERTVLISLSPEGQALKTEAVAIPQKILALFQEDALEKGELKNFQQTLFKLVERLSEKT